MSPRISARNFWKNWPYKTLTLIILAVVIIALLVLALMPSPEDTSDVTPLNKQVKATTLADIGLNASIVRTATLEPSSHAPLIARTGGRVTAVHSEIGTTVEAGKTIVAIDGKNVPSPTEAQIAGLSQSLAQLNNVQRQAIASADIAIRIARQNLDAAQAGRGLTQELQQLTVDSARERVDQAQFTYEQTLGQPVDALTDAAEVGVDLAKLAREQAAVGRDIASRQNNDALQLARQNVAQSETAKTRALAELGVQRAQLNTQLQIAQATIAASQVTSPIQGVVASLNVRTGDFVTPGQQIGEVANPNGGFVRLHVSRSVAERLTPGMLIGAKSNSIPLTGEVANVATIANNSTSLYQLDVAFASLPPEVSHFSTITVELPTGSVASTTFLVPLDALVVRENGILIFTVDPQTKIVREHIVEVVGYHGSFVEVSGSLIASDLIVTANNRTLREGELVEISE